MSINTATGRKYDYYRELIVPNNCYFIVRLDGNCFSSFTERYQRPFDERFYKAMKIGAKYLMKKLPDIFKIHFHSDEISCYFKRESDWFNRRIEKIVSITAGMLSSIFSKEVDSLVQFDSRILITPTMKDIEEYEKDRRLNAFRGCVNSYSFYLLANEVGIREAHNQLKGLDSKQRQEFLFTNFNINIAKVPKWQRVGVFLEWEEYEKEGFNPITNSIVNATRRRIKEY